MKVQEVMSRPIRTCRPNDSLNTASQLMWDDNCGAVAVVNAEGRVIAMITDRDICMAAYTQGKRLTEMPVSSAASQGVVSVQLNESVDTAEALMREHGVRRLPVVDASGRPMGILSMTDLAPPNIAWATGKSD